MATTMTAGRAARILLLAFATACSTTRSTADQRAPADGATEQQTPSQEFTPSMKIPGCLVPSCALGISSWHEEFGCCHDPCTDGDMCSSMCAQFFGVSCVCENGAPSCCNNGLPLIVDCHDAAKCPHLASIEACADCCLGAYETQEAKDVIVDGCVCQPSHCGAACGGNAEVCAVPTPIMAKVSLACGVCVAQNIGPGHCSSFIHSAGCLESCRGLPSADGGMP